MREDENKEAKIRRKVRMEGGKAVRDSRDCIPPAQRLEPPVGLDSAEG
jgi:hypothetical protein